MDPFEISSIRFGCFKAELWAPAAITTQDSLLCECRCGFRSYARLQWFIANRLEPPHRAKSPKCPKCKKSWLGVWVLPSNPPPDGIREFANRSGSDSDLFLFQGRTFELPRFMAKCNCFWDGKKETWVDADLLGPALPTIKGTGGKSGYGLDDSFGR